MHDEQGTLFDAQGTLFDSIEIEAPVIFLAKKQSASIFQREFRMHNAYSLVQTAFWRPTF